MSKSIPRLKTAIVELRHQQKASLVDFNSPNIPQSCLELVMFGLDTGHVQTFAGNHVTSECCMLIMINELFVLDFHDFLVN